MRYCNDIFLVLDEEILEVNQEQQGVTTRKQQPPPLPPQVQRQKQTTVDQTAVCSSNGQQQVRVRKRKQKAKAKDKSAKKVREENGIDWVSWKYGNERHSSMDGLVEGIWNSVRVWDTERTEWAGGGKAATMARFRSLGFLPKSHDFGGDNSPDRLLTLLL
jgi:hypothetical protein